MIGAARHFLKEQAVNLIQPVLTNTASQKSFGGDKRNAFERHQAETERLINILKIEEVDSDSTGDAEAGSENESIADRELDEDNKDDGDNENNEGENDAENDIYDEGEGEDEVVVADETSKKNEHKDIEIGSRGKQRGESSTQRSQNSSSFTRWGGKLQSKTPKTLDDQFTRTSERLGMHNR